MSSKSAFFAIHALAMLAVIGVAPTSVTHSDVDALSFSRQSTAVSAASATMVLAQGRCYNGRCY
jgi:hypothetical protein